VSLHEVRRAEERFFSSANMQEDEDFRNCWVFMDFYQQSHLIETPTTSATENPGWCSEVMPSEGLDAMVMMVLR
jgi:hypothetical protein